MRPTSRCRGMTLLEVLVALAVFALVAAMAYGGLNAASRSAQGVRVQTDNLRELQGTMLMLGLDLRQMVDRPIRDNYGSGEAALLVANGGESRLSLTRGGYRNPAALARSGVQRVAYRLEDGILYRDSWAVLDRAQDSEPRSTALLHGVSELSLRLLDANNEWHDSWPPYTDEGAAVPLPRALELTLESEAWGEVRRIFETSGWVAELPAPPAAGGGVQ